MNCKIQVYFKCSDMYYTYDVVRYFSLTDKFLADHLIAAITQFYSSTDVKIVLGQTEGIYLLLANRKFFSKLLSSQYRVDAYR